LSKEGLSTGVKRLEGFSEKKDFWIYRKFQKGRPSLKHCICRHGDSGPMETMLIS
jgi:hypothetical protein